MKLLVIIPTWNEAGNITRCVSSLSEDTLVVDGGSTDGTADIARKYTRVITAPRGLAHQCNAGARSTRAEWLFFLSADSVPPENWREKLRDAAASPYVVGGGFSLELDDPGFLFRILSFGGNVRAHWDRVSLGDQGLFVRREDYLSVGGMCPKSEVPYARLCFALQERGEFLLFPDRMLSSSRAWKEKGFFSTTLSHIRTYRRFKTRVS